MTLISKRRIFGGLGALALIGATAGLTLNTTAAQNPQTDMRIVDDHDGNREAVQVGTFQPQSAFERYHRAEELSQQMQELQMEMQQAQQEGDQQRMMELQQRMQQMQNEVVEQFYDDLDRSMPEIAEEANVQIVAVDVVYTDPSIGEARDLTEKVVEHLNGDAADDRLQDDVAPGSPW